MKKNLGSIAIITKFFWPVAAGIETNILETYASLVKTGWDVSAYTTKNSLTASNAHPQAEETVRGIKVHRVTWLPLLGYWPNINLNQTDLVCLHNFNVVPHFWFMAFTGILKMLGRKKYALILTPHGGYNPEWRIFREPQRSIKQWYHRVIGTFMINATVDAVRAVSEWERQEMIASGLKPELITVIHNGIENQAFADNEKEVSPEFKKRVTQLGRYLIQIGRIHTIKNYETTIKALAQLPKDIKFVIAGPVGEEWYLAKLHQLISKHNLEGRVIFWGVVRGAEKYYLIKHAQMMVHMAMWESYCNVVHEGMSQGLVCLVANNTALPLLIKDGVNGYCLSTKNVKTLVAKIKYVLDPKQTAVMKKIGRYNKTHVTEHSWENVAKKVNELYQEQLVKRRGK